MSTYFSHHAVERIYTVQPNYDAVQASLHLFVTTCIIFIINSLQAYVKCLVSHVRYLNVLCYIRSLVHLVEHWVI